METSTKFGFNLPSRDSDDIADINQISDNFRIIEENVPSNDDLKNVKIKIDKVFDPTSENAQSGKAVAQAVSIEQNRADNTFANALKGSKSGSAILIDDVSPITHEMGVKVSGKNLIPYPYSETTKTINGITFTDNRDGTITVNGTSTDSANFWLHPSDSVNLKAGTYTLSGCPSGGSHGTYCLVCTISNSTTPSIDEIEQTFYDIGNGITFEVTFDAFVCWNIHIDWDVTVDNLVFKPQLELGTTATAYTPYVDLTAVKVKKQGKNLIPYPYSDLKLGTTTTNGVDFTVYEDGSILINGTATISTSKYLYRNETDLLGLKSGIAISANKNASDDTQQANVYFICNYYDSAGKMQMGIQASTTSSGTKTISDDWKGLGIYINIPKGKTLNNLLIKPQLEIGTTATEYEPYSTPIEYTPTADGVVNGVTSLYPSTTLTTDTEGVLIDCEYNRDINKAFAELQAAIISFGGTI